MGARRKLRNPGPAISTAAMSPPVGIAADSACAIARGLLRAGFASSMAALLEKSPWARSLGRSITKSGVARSAGRVPCSRRAAMPCSTRALSVDFTGVWTAACGRTLYASPRHPAPPAHVPPAFPVQLDPAARRQRDRGPVADDEMVEQA